jgi:hypothetical protein
MEQIITMNNQAAGFIESGQYEHAVMLLNTGVRQARALVHQAATGCSPGEEKSTECLDLSSREPQLQGQDRNPACMTCCDDYDSRSYPFLYKSPIVLSTSWRTFEGNETMSAMVFNLALVYHMSAEKASSKSRNCCANDGLDPIVTRKLEKALKLYELACTIDKLAFPTSQHDGSLSTALARVNNSAMILRQLKQESRANQLLVQLSASLMMTIEAGQAQNVDQLEGFLSNASTVILTQCTAGAA